MDNQQATKELSWLAGFIEADGSLQIMVQMKANNTIKLTPLVTGVGCEIELIDRCIMIFQSHCQVNPHRNSFNQGGNKRIAHRFVLAKQAHCMRALEKLECYLFGRKKEIANLIIEFCQSRMSKHKKTFGGLNPYSKRELEITQRISQLNSVGTSETTRKSVERVNLALQKI